MALFYSFPSTIYVDAPATSDLDEIEILGPVLFPLAMPANVETSAKMVFQAVTQDLTGVVVRVTMARFHTISALKTATPAGPNPVAPTGTAWTFAASASEATWTAVGTVAQGTSTTFEVKFKPTQPGSYTYTYSVKAAQLSQPALTQVDVVVV